ncbi:MAG: type II toxin-antitoxin system VapC family toxin [Desulfurococcaceae archaeon]|nr:type II toxin-antitoxin system VapC family toxin [Desulfurococcaceae archaeon]MCC6057982.1 type II toxin-antitoxin system VapC family toxin [Desulfurococcaceae archaeon]
MIVVDASAAVAFFLREEGWRDIALYMKRGVSVDHIIKEFYNAVWRSLYLKRLPNRESAQEILQLFKSYVEKNIVIEPEEKYIDKAFEISVENNITIYDALYIALAIDKKLPLLTLDEKQRYIALKLGIEVLP